MSGSVLVGLDVEGIQRWVFASNRLRHVVGASALVERAASPAPGGLLAPWKDRVEASGGGNALLRLDEVDLADFTARYGRSLLEEMAGLEVAVASQPYHPGAEAADVVALGEALARAKASRPRHAPLAGLGVTAACAETGAAAVGTWARPPDRAVVVPASAQVLAAEKAFQRDRRWAEFVSTPPDKLPTERSVAFPRELDDLGRTPEIRSKIAVVHVDGNGVGKRIETWLRGRGAADDRRDEDVLQDYRRLSRSIGDAMTAGLQAAVGMVLANLDWDPGTNGAVLRGRFPELDFDLASEGSTDFLPIRPVLAGGDDLTFVCDARIALDLAEAAVDAIARAEIADDAGALSACAGVAVGAAHTPFLRLYTLAEQLCRNAKTVARRERWDEGALDWHIDGAGPAGDLAELRPSAYETRSAHGTRLELTMRPYRLGLRKSGDPRSWRWLRDELLGPDQDRSLRGPFWSRSRGKARALADEVRWPDGLDKILEACRALGLELPDPIAAGAFLGGVTPLLDAVELLGLAQQLDPPGPAAGPAAMSTP